MPNDSKHLTASKVKKDDEFYTLYEDIANELPNYKDQLRDKRIICPCDWDESLEEICVYATEEYVQGSTLFSGGTIKTFDAYKLDKHIEKSIKDVKCNFVKFLLSHAEDYGIKSISVSGYNPATEEGVRFQDIDYSKYDIAITNPPFSEFTEFIDTMYANDMKFLVIGPQNAIKYKAVFPHIQANELWLGYHYHLAGFIRPDGSRVSKQDNLARSCCWFSNLDVKYRHNRLMLDVEYDPQNNPTYINLDAIDVNRSKLIPYDYDGVMGVPITFMQVYNPDQFEIVGITETLKAMSKEVKGGAPYIMVDGKPKRLYTRILIRKRKDGDDEKG